MVIHLLIILLLVTASCTKKPDAPPVEPSSDLYWQGKGDYAPAWDLIAMNAVSTYGKDILMAADMPLACKNFAKISDDDKKKAVIQLIAGVIKYESDFKLNTYSVEPASAFPEKDPVTGKPVASEGLLQLSYQDEVSYKGLLPDTVCKFTWALDKNLANTDKNKSIFQPKVNLECGVAILNLQVKKRGVIFYDKSYWAVLRPNGKYGQVPAIKAIANSFKPCKGE